MREAAISDPSLTIALALAAGMIAQVTARHLRVPGLVLLLGAGVLLGPDGLGVVRPATLGSALHTLVGFAVAVILFEGGLGLDARHLRRQARSIRQLVTWGALVTALGAALSARWILGWPWRISALFGTLVIVTGPTVITPLLRRIRVSPRVATVLEAEGVFGDAIGALLAVVALDVALTPFTRASLVFGVGALALRLGTGAAIGLLGGLVLVFLLRAPRLIPEGLENISILSLVLLLFQASNAVLAESGIAAAIVAGLVVGNLPSRVDRDLRNFKEQLTVLLIGMLFVLLAADVRLAEVRALGLAGIATVAALMFVVRPLNTLVGTWGSDLTLRERAFIAWIAPRGIVAAAVASLFAEALAEAGIAGGRELRALVFLTIATTVVVQGLSGGPVAGWLGLRRVPSGYAVLGASGLGLAVARLLRDAGLEAILIDSNPDAQRRAEAQGFTAFFGSALEEQMLTRMGIADRLGAFAVTTNDEVNLLFARIARREYRVAKVWVALRLHQRSVRSEMLDRLGVHLLFGTPRRLELWSGWLETGAAEVERWRRDRPAEPSLPAAEDQPHLLPLALSRGKNLLPFDETLRPQIGDELHAAVVGAERPRIHAALAAAGWAPVTESALPPFGAISS